MSRYLGTTVPAAFVHTELARGELVWGETEQRWVTPTRVAPRRYESEMAGPAMMTRPSSGRGHLAPLRAVVKAPKMSGSLPAPEGDAEMRRALAVPS